MAAAPSSAGPTPWWRSAAATSTPPTGPRWAGNAPTSPSPSASTSSPPTASVDLDCGPVTLDAVRRLACDAAITPIVTRHGQPIAAGRRTRVVPASLRRALNHRDRGCTHPGCDTPAHWCDAHHITHWADGGPTALANLRLLCRRHHRIAHEHQPYPQSAE